MLTLQIFVTWAAEVRSIETPCNMIVKGDVMLTNDATWPSHASCRGPYLKPQQNTQRPDCLQLIAAPSLHWNKNIYIANSFQQTYRSGGFIVHSIIFWKSFQCWNNGFERPQNCCHSISGAAESCCLNSFQLCPSSFSLFFEECSFGLVACLEDMQLFQNSYGSL